MFAEDIIIKPVLTEKGYDGIADKKYTFYVKKDANKIQIKLAVEKLFGVKVAKVNTITCKGKLKRMGCISNPLRERWMPVPSSVLIVKN